MAAKTFREPKPSPNDRDMLKVLEQAGFTRDPNTGEIVHTGGGFEGGTPPPADPGNPFGSEGTVESVHTVLPGGDRLEEDQGGEELPGEPPAEPEPEAEPKPKPGEQTEEGLKKREADARAAQSAYSKAKADADKALAAVNKRISDLDEQIQKLATLQTTAGPVPDDLNPADPSVVAQYREDYPEAVGVMEALVAPVYQIIGALREQLNGVVQRQGEYFSRLKQDEVFGGIYEKIPKERVKQITESPTFLDWIGTKPPRKANLYVDVLNNTSNYTPEEALEIFKEFSLETGTDIGLNGKPRRQSPPTDTAPRARTGSALPPPASHQPSTPTENTPLSAYELAHFKDILGGFRTEAERQMFLHRFNATQINIDGREARTFV